MVTNPPPAPPEPLTLAAVKQNLRVTSAADDALIGGLIRDAREFVERETGQVLVPRAITETAPELGRWVDLSSWPVTQITAIRYPLAGVMTPLIGAAWVASYKARPVRILPTSWGWGVGAGRLVVGQLPVEIDVQAGYATPDLVPRAATRAMHMLIAHWYANRATAEVGGRAAAVEVPFAVTVLCRQLKLARV